MSKMRVSFNLLGLALDAVADYYPRVEAQTYGDPAYCYPAEGGYAEITALSCAGKDALFLLDGDLRDDLEQLAYDACVESDERRREDARVEDYIRRHYYLRETSYDAF